MMKVGSRTKVTGQTTKRFLKVWKKLLKVVPAAYSNIQLAFVFTESPTYKTYQGGYAVKFTINIGVQYASTYTTEIAIAEILSHELAHHILGHVNLSDEDDFGAIAEQDADHLGLFICELAGFKRQDYIQHFMQYESGPFRNNKLDESHVDSHGTGDKRVKRLTKQDKYLIDLENY